VERADPKPDNALPPASQEAMAIYLPSLSAEILLRFTLITRFIDLFIDIFLYLLPSINDWFKQLG
jgi:hypothetical protein